jgi:hypothetical protein
MHIVVFVYCIVAATYAVMQSIPLKITTAVSLILATNAS